MNCKNLFFNAVGQQTVEFVAIAGYAAFLPRFVLHNNQEFSPMYNSHTRPYTITL